MKYICITYDNKFVLVEQLYFTPHRGRINMKIIWFNVTNFIYETIHNIYEKT